MKSRGGGSRAAAFPFCTEEPFTDELAALCVPLVEGTGKDRCGARGSVVTALVVPFELASPSPSADMLPVRARLDARESVVVLCVAEELVAPSGSWGEPSSASARRLRPSTWRAAGSVVEARAPCLVGSGLEAFTAGSVVWCWEAAARVEDGAERSVLGEDGGRGVVDGWSELDGVDMGAGERGLRSATASSAGVSISRCVRPLTGRKRRD